MSLESEPRRRGVAGWIAILAAVLALIAGIAIGYASRGEPDAGAPVTVEGEVPVVTVTVPAP